MGQHARNRRLQQRADLQRMARQAINVDQPQKGTVQVSYLDGELAEPFELQLPTEKGFAVKIIGGLTKLEWMAGQVAAGMPGDLVDDGRRDLRPEDVMRYVDTAEAILIECQRRASLDLPEPESEPQPERPKNPKKEKEPSPIIQP